MTTLAISQVSTASSNQNDRYSGEFDAAIGLPAKTTEGEYWQGYLAKVNQTGNTPF